jgi:hypothetical protein
MEEKYIAVRAWRRGLEAIPRCVDSFVPGIRAREPCAGCERWPGAGAPDLWARSKSRVLRLLDLQRYAEDGSGEAQQAWTSAEPSGWPRSPCVLINSTLATRFTAHLVLATAPDPDPRDTVVYVGTCTTAIRNGETCPSLVYFHASLSPLPPDYHQALRLTTTAPSREKRTFETPLYPATV